MKIMDHNLQAQEKWRNGVMTRMQISAINEIARRWVPEAFGRKP